jgi:UDP-N-acetyl-2-amino-2-deoxyglucuronate dehydrogenase
MALSFALIGAAGFVAPRHMRAIQGHRQPAGRRARSQRQRRRHRQLLSRRGLLHRVRALRPPHRQTAPQRCAKVDYVSICSPNYLHDAHIRFALRNRAARHLRKAAGAESLERRRPARDRGRDGRRVYNILQLRLHPRHHRAEGIHRRPPAPACTTSISATSPPAATGTRRSWKGQIEKSGGIATNIGVHFFDMLTWVFGKVATAPCTSTAPTAPPVPLQLKNAHVRWFLSDQRRAPARGAARQGPAHLPLHHRGRRRKSNSPTASPTCTPTATATSSPARGSGSRKAEPRWRSCTRSATHRSPRSRATTTPSAAR